MDSSREVLIHQGTGALSVLVVMERYGLSFTRKLGLDPECETSGSLLKYCLKEHQLGMSSSSCRHPVDGALSLSYKAVAS